MKAGNSGVNYTIPSCIKPGYYLVRHETIALHSATGYPGAQFYPGCHQLKVTGGGNTTPSNLVSFPGAYASSDPGVTYNPYQGELSPLSLSIAFTNSPSSYHLQDSWPCCVQVLD